MITQQQVLDVQTKWGNGAVKIGSLKNDFEACKKFTGEFLDLLYAFELGAVLFKPTKCATEQFRPTKPEALSYFIAGEDRACQEDKGFALNPWTKVRFENSEFILEENRAVVMGNYFFTDLNGDETKVEFTFGYKTVEGQLKIDLHHSSLPFSG